MVSYGHHIFRRIPFSILSHELILRALVMERDSVLIDELQGIDDILFFDFWYSHAAPPLICSVFSYIISISFLFTFSHSWSSS